MKRKIHKIVSGAKQAVFALALLASGLGYSQATYTFNYTGAVQPVNLSAGPHLIEMWGGDGYTQTVGYNGRGGYASGILTLLSAQTIYVYVGERGGYPQSGVNANTWTFNGGAIGYPANNASYGNGGGASDVRTVGGTWDNVGSLASRAIVAGGGGAGRNTTYIGGHGGGLTGGTGTFFSPDQTGGPTGGSQTAGGSNTGYTSGLTLATLGKAATWDGNALTASFLAGGGGGYYGGASGRVAGGGGSSYLGGVTSGTTIMYGQPGYVPNPDITGNGYVIITQLAQPCTASIETPTLTGSVPENSICLHAGETENIGVIFGGVAYIGVDYNWLASSSPNGPFSTVATTNGPGFVTPGMGGTPVYYKVEATCVNEGVMVVSDIYATLPNPTVALSSAPSINFNSSSLVVCTNDHYTITASGAAAYDWHNGAGQAIGVNPYVLMPVPAFPDYTVTGISAEGCTDTNTMTIATILEAPVVTAASFTNSICKGNSVILFALGNALTYTWSANANSSNAAVIVLEPNQSEIYTVVGTSTNGCSSPASVSLTVLVPEAISVSSSKPNDICAGETVNLTATGAVSYTWISSNAILKGASVMASPEVTTNYLVNSIDANGCHNSVYFQQKVSDCVGINELKNGGLNLNVYPNPNSGAFTIELNNGGLQKTLELFDLTGRKVLSNATDNDMINLDVSELQNGVYFLNVKSNNTTQTVKIVKH